MKPLDWFRLRDGACARLAPEVRGVIESEEFPGLRLAVTNLIDGDAAGVLAKLNEEWP